MLRFPLPKRIDTKANDFNEWLELHEKSIPFLSIIRKTENDQSKQFFEKRNSEHRRLKKTIGSAADRFIKVENNVEIEIKKLEEKYKNLEKATFYYSNPVEDMTVRKMVFVRREYYERTIRYLSEHLNNILSRLFDIQYITELLGKISIPDDVIVTLGNDFFRVEIDMKKMNETNRLFSKLKEYQKIIKGYNIPLFIRNPKSFFISLRETALQKADRDSMYFGFLKDEIDFSIYLFRSRCVEGAKIDKFIAEQEEIEFINFGEKSLKLCSTLIPSSSKAKEQMIAISLFFRQIMERAYEKYYKVIPMNRKIVEFMQITNKPMNEILPVTCGTPFPPETPLKDAFLFDPLIKESIMQLLDSVLVANVIDSLHYVSLSLEMLQQASIISKLQREPMEEEIKTFVGFEEIFSLLLGAILSSDIPDIFHYAAFVKKMAPMSMLSPELEFAATNIIAILDHILTL